MPFLNRFVPSTISARFSARFFSARFSAHWMLIGQLPITPFQMLYFHQSIPFLNRFVPSTISARFSASKIFRTGC